MEEMENIVLNNIFPGGCEISATVSTPKQNPIKENKPETIAIEETAPLPHNLPPVFTPTGKTANQCGFWRTGACEFPGDPSCVLPTNNCPETCKSFITQEELERQTKSET